MIIKQNNTQIYLLIQIAESLKDIQTDLKFLTKQNQNSGTSTALPESLITKLQGLTLGPQEKPKEGKGKLRVYKDPFSTLKEEQEKLKRRHDDFGT